MGLHKVPHYHPVIFSAKVVAVESGSSCKILTIIQVVVKSLYFITPVDQGVNMVRSALMIGTQVLPLNFILNIPRVVVPLEAQVTGS